jgi:hypothetical protein
LPDPITYPAGDCITANSNQLHDANGFGLLISIDSALLSTIFGCS